MIKEAMEKAARNGADCPWFLARSKPATVDDPRQRQIAGINGEIAAIIWGNLEVLDEPTLTNVEPTSRGSAYEEMKLLGRRLVPNVGGSRSDHVTNCVWHHIRDT